MLFRMIYDDGLAAAAYLIGCQRTGEAIVIDPERDVDRYIALAAKEKMKIVAAAETHIHADFLSGARELAERVGAKVYLSDEGDADWKYQWLDKKRGGGAYEHRLVRDGDLFHVGKIEFRVVHTPGHTPEHVCFVVTDRGGGADQPMGILSGDFLFVGDLGRPDLLETAAGLAGQAAGSARRLFQTVRRLDSMPEWLQVWPAHGAGSACGKALGAVPQSTVGYEKRFNPALRAATSEAAFTAFILGGQPEPPLYFARMKRDNRMGPPLLGELPRPAPIALSGIGVIDGHACAIIDTRGWDRFRAGHLPGSLFHPINDSFATDVGSMVREGEPIYLVATPERVEEGVRLLARIGYDDVRGFITPTDLEAYASGGGAMETIPEVSVAEARRMAGAGPVLDVRRATEFAEGHIEGAMNIAHTRLMSRLDELPRGRAILVNCRSGGRSARACALLRKNGFEPVNLAGGYSAWETAGKEKPATVR